MSVCTLMLLSNAKTCDNHWGISQNYRESVSVQSNAFVTNFHAPGWLYGNRHSHEAKSLSCHLCFVFYRYTRLVLSNTDSSSKQILENIHNSTYVFLRQTCWRTRAWGAFPTSAHISTNFVYLSYICVFFRLVAPNCTSSLRKISVGLTPPFVRNLTTMFYTTLG